MDKKQEVHDDSQNSGKRVLPAYFNFSPTNQKAMKGPGKRKFKEISGYSESDDEPEYQSSESESTPEVKLKKGSRPKKRTKMNEPKSLIIEGKRPRRKPQF
jgi:hypothetical protein